MDGMNQPRLLFVGTDEGWRAAAQSAADRRGAVLDVMPDVKSALSSMLPPGLVYEHVMAVAPLRSRAIDALAGMLDEVTLSQTPLLLLGCASSGTAMQLPCVETATGEAVLNALGGNQPAFEPMAPMQWPEFVATLHSGGLRMRFQPILRAADLQPIGLEALARLHHGKRGILHPRDFIPLMATSGRERVFTGIAAARTFLEVGARLKQAELFVTLNLPLSAVMHDLAVERGIELCKVADASPNEIIIEVLESRTAPDLGRLREALQRWHAAGFRTAIDDAGPALPHWLDLLDLPFDVVKLDGAMVANPGQQGLLERITGEAKARGRIVVAEGVEDEACLGRVMALDVDALQGFLFSRPLPAMAVPIWLDRWRQDRTLN